MDAISITDQADFDDHEQVVFVADRSTGLRAIIAIHDTRLGPSLGGCRLWHYGSETDAVRDALRLSRGMTYKNALAGLPLGGGKSVIFGPGDPRRTKSPALLRAMGTAVQRLGGRYVVAEDVGTSEDDMAAIRERTRHVVGLEAAQGGRGNPSPKTARGVYLGLRAAVRHRLGRVTLAGTRVAVQGLGQVGWGLAQLLQAEGAELWVSDIRPEKVADAARQLGATPVGNATILDTPVDVFAPCALGGVIDDDAVGRLRAKVVAGAANNQLASARQGSLLRDRGILYAPDYVINAGGVIHVGGEWLGWDQETVDARVEGLSDVLMRIFQAADRSGTSTSKTADRMAEAVLNAARDDADLAA